MRTILFPLLFSFLFLALTACTKKSTTQDKAASQEVNLAIWGNYMAPEIQKKFTEQTGIKINISNYSSNEELLAKVQSGASGIDVAVPSDYMVQIMIKTGLLEELKIDQIPNAKLISSEWLNPAYDQGNKFSLPYGWSTTGIAINRELYKGSIKGWKDLFNSKDLKGKVSLLDDGREVAGAALKMNGFSLNTTKTEELKKAKEDLLSFKPQVKMFRSDTIDALTNKEVAVAQAYSVDALQAAAKTNGKIEYVVPSEGSTLSTDNVVIMKGSKNPQAALQLINFLLSSEANLSFVKNVYGGPILNSTIESLPPEMKNNKGLFPGKETLAKMEKMVDLGESTRLYDELWTEIKSK